MIKEGAVTSVTSSESQVSNTTASLSGDVANGAIPSPQQVLSSIASRYLNNLNPSTQEDFNSFVRYMREVREVILVDCKPGSLIITVECGSLKILEELWQDYCTGNLGRVVQECLVTEDILKELGLSEIKMITTIDEKDYRDCQEYLARGRYDLYNTPMRHSCYGTTEFKTHFKPTNIWFEKFLTRRRKRNKRV